MKYFFLLFLITSIACGTDAPTSDLKNNGSKTGTGADMSPIPDMGNDEGISPQDVAADITQDTDPGPQSCEKTKDCDADEVCKFDPSTGKSVCTSGGKNNGETCVSGAECASGVCINNACADLCKGESDCPGGFTCATETVSTNSGNVQISVCVPESKPCLSNNDCSNGEVCMLNAENKLECQAPIGNGGLGDACSAHAECASNLCLDSVCTLYCERPNDCKNDGSYICDGRTINANGGTVDANVCIPKPASQCLSDSDCTSPKRCVATKTATDVEFQCGTPNAGGKSLGENCTGDANCASNLCVNQVCAGPCQSNGDCAAIPDGSCELVNVVLGNGNSDSVQICTPPVDCVENADCRVNETCYIRATQAKTDVFCRAPNVGAGSLGQVCSIPLECSANYCLPTSFRDVCTEACNDNADCNVAGYSCQPFSFTDGTSAKICQPSAPTTCTSNNDCAAGTICSIIPDATGTGLQSACVPSTGGDAAGVACQHNNDCASLLCLDGFCSAPCTDANQCTAGQLCQNENITIGGASATIKVCKTPPTIQCADSSDCIDGVRVCSLASDGNGNLIGNCDFPNANGSQMGSTCAVSSDCRANICLTNISDTCTVICNDDSDCAAGLGCTTYGSLGFCNKTCADNSDCGVNQACTINSDSIANDIDLVCHNKNAGGGDLGATCASGADCATGLCLTTTSYTTTDCTLDADCTNAGETCKCPTNQPNCNTGKKCAVQAKQCTNLCNDNNDCSVGVVGNALTVCSSNTVVSLPNGQGTKTIATCAHQ